MSAWREPDLVDRQVAHLWAAVAVATVVLAPLWRVFVPGLPRCAFRSLAGLPCPTCGAGRAVEALLGGDVVEAASFNPLLTFAAFVLVVGGLVSLLWVRCGGVVPARGPSPPAWVRGSLVLLLVGNWIYLVARGI